MKNNKRNTHAKQNMTTKSEVKSMIKASKMGLIKYVDTIIDFNPIVNTVTLYALTMPAVGTGQNNRQADSIRIDHLEVHTTDFFLDTVTTSGQCLYDKFLVYQNVGEAIITSAPDLYDLTGTNLQIYNSPLSYSNKGKLFRPLLEHKVHLDTFNATASQVWKRIKPSISEMRYNALDAQWSTGLPAVMISRYAGGVSGGSAAVLEMVVRLWFYDV